MDRPVHLPAEPGAHRPLALRRRARVTTGQYTESSHKWQAKPGAVMTGRTHYGDENGKTTYRFATVYFEG
ncbi:hypothetical protein ABZ860_27970 [Microbispora sp. NPDC046973]|uniref:hypothetical protein n=1 Tax=Microbispora sp. NPDC046973 TaxID=3155022 RepID=UPI0033EB18E7